MTDAAWVKNTVDDIVKAAELCGVPHDRANVEKTVTLFEPKLKRGYIQFRVTNKPAGKGRELNYRYQGRIDTTTPWVFARANGYTTAPEADKLMEECWQAMPTARECVDFDPKQGVTKIWHMHEGWQTLSLVRDKIPSLPKAVDNYIDTFKQYKIDHIFLLTGLDRRHPSVNLYFGLLKANRSFEATKGLISALGFEVTDEQIKDWAEFDVISCTFLWSSDKIDRICFYRQLTQKPQGMDPFFDELVAKGVPTTRDTPYFSFGHSFTHHGPYLKFEWDYLRSVNDFEQELYKDQLHIYWKRKLALAEEGYAKAKQELEAKQTSGDQSGLDTANEALTKAKETLDTAKVKFAEAKEAAEISAVAGL